MSEEKVEAKVEKVAKAPKIVKCFKVTEDSLVNLENLIANARFDTFKEGLPLQQWVSQIVQLGTFDVTVKEE